MHLGVPSAVCAGQKRSSLKKGWKENSTRPSAWTGAVTLVNPVNPPWKLK